MYTDTPNDLPEYFTNICKGLVFSWQILGTHAIPAQRPLGPFDENQMKCQKITLYLTWVHIPNWTGLLIGCAFLYEAFVVTGNMRSSFNANSLMEARSGKCMLLPFTNIMSWMWSQYYLWAAGKSRLGTASPCLQMVSTKNQQSVCVRVTTGESKSRESRMEHLKIILKTFRKHQTNLAQSGLWERKPTSGRRLNRSGRMSFM